tara:strand:+ start:60 stop:284 length:225 start_codon:yes stop_codon:yes gene_type:complete
MTDYNKFTTMRYDREYIPRISVIKARVELANERNILKDDMLPVMTFMLEQLYKTRPKLFDTLAKDAAFIEVNGR